MAKYSREQLQEAILSELEAGDLPHNELVARLENAGYADAGRHILNLANRRLIVPSVRRDAEGERATLRYRLPSNADFPGSIVSQPAPTANMQRRANKGGVQ